jgi:hypothetical protein
LLAANVERLGEKAVFKVISLHPCTSAEKCFAATI